MDLNKLWCKWCGSHPVQIGSMVCTQKDCYNYDLLDSLGLKPEANAVIDAIDKMTINGQTIDVTGSVIFSKKDVKANARP